MTAQPLIENRQATWSKPKHPRICPVCDQEMGYIRFGDFDSHWYCDCDLTHVEGDGTCPGVGVPASFLDDDYDPFEGEGL